MAKPKPVRLAGLYAGWGRARDDERDYAQLLARFRLGWQPVRPAERKAPHIEGQLPLFPSERRWWP